MANSVFRADPAHEYYFEEGCYILEHLNDPADPAASIARARVPPHSATRPHLLAGTTERYLILSGQGAVSVGSDAALEVAAGDTVLIPPGVTQSIVNKGQNDLVFLAICTPRFRRACYQAVPAAP